MKESGQNNCLQDTAMVLLGTKACQEIGIKTAAELRNLEVKEITDNPALANELMKEAAKLSILKPTAMMQGGRPWKRSVWDLRIPDGNHIKNPSDTKKKKSSKAPNDHQEVETASDLLDIPSNPGPRLLNPYAFANLSTNHSFVGVPEKLLKIMRLPNQKLIYEADSKIAVDILQQMREGQNLKEEKAKVYEGKMEMEQEEKTGIVTLENAANLVKQYLKDLEENKEPILLKKQGVELLKQIEVLKKKEKTAYRQEGVKLLSIDEQDESAKNLIIDKKKKQKANLETLRSLRKQLQEATETKPGDDYSSSEEWDLARDEGGTRIADSITLENGQVVKIIFGVSKSEKQSANNLIHPKLINTLEKLLDRMSQLMEVKTICISCTTNGKHGNKSNHSVHQKARAIDISEINGKSVEDLGQEPNQKMIKLWQDIIDELPDIRENFGPCFFHKKERGKKPAPWKHPNPIEHERLVKKHKDHIHFSVNG